MEDEKDFSKLERLERSVERLLDGYNNLLQEKVALAEQVASQSAEINELRETVASLQGDKVSIHQRVSGLLSSIEAWEESQDTAAVKEVDVVQTEKEEIASGGIGATMDDPQMSMMSIVR
ncbi:MAG: cell division protein ZapB [Desulfobulbaceae bacterium]|nr:cell division protein ZapB [Desulfobulbaceae bacterium]